MRTALHRDTYKVLDALAYEKAYGKRVDQWGNPRARPNALCEVCRQDVFLRAELSNRRDANFSHFDKGPFCPVKAFSADAYRALRPAPHNPEAAARLCREFFATWRYHWEEFNRIISYGSIFDFAAVLAYANANGIWDYRDMQVKDVLPVLLALMDFPPLRKEKRHLRDYGLRFFYTGSVANTGQYWNLPEHERSLTMVKYEFPGRTTTFQEDNISSKDLVVFDAGYAAGQFEADVDAQPQVHPFTLKIMTEKFGDQIAN